MAVTAKTLRLSRKARADLARITDTHTRELTAAWVKAWDEVADDLDAAATALVASAENGFITRSMALRSTRLRNALDAIARQLARLADDAGIRIAGDLTQVVRAAGEAQEAIIASQLPRAEAARVVGWDRVDSRQVAEIVQRTTERITSEMWPLSAEADGVIRRELVRAVAAGTNPRQTAARMVKRAEQGFNGGLSRALVIARTETIDAHRAGAALSHQVNADVLAGWTWLCALGARTCPACLAMHGTEHKLTDPGPQGHQQCRCARGPRAKSWKELGINLPEQPSVVPDAGAWFAKQPTKTQQGILGPARYKAWKAGAYPMDRWVTRRPNPDWRPSYVTTPAP